MIFFTISTHRRHTSNHTCHVTVAGHQLFAKANPNHGDAAREIAGHQAIEDLYPVPALRGRIRLGHWALSMFDRVQLQGPGEGLLVDHLAYAHEKASLGLLDSYLGALLRHYYAVIGHTASVTPQSQTVGKLFQDRVAPGGRLDQYYPPGTVWPNGLMNQSGRPAAANTFDVNGRVVELDYPAMLQRLRSHFNADRNVWSAITQGDPTSMNLAATALGPIWFDYDTAGRNAIAGEFACFLMDICVYSLWIGPLYGRSAYEGHPVALAMSAEASPDVSITVDQDAIRIRYRLRPLPAQRYAMNRYLQELVYPIAHDLGITDVKSWLAPYLVLRILGVYPLTVLAWTECAPLIGLLADTLDPDVALHDLLGLDGATQRSSPAQGRRQRT